MTLLEREPVLAELRERFASARRRGGELVLVSGEAGIGKTALIDAFVARLPRGTPVLRGACDPVVPPRPFAPIWDMAAGASEGLATTLLAGDRDRVFERFLATLRQLGSGSVVIIEDLHWADTATLDLLRVLGRRLPDVATLVVGSYRGYDIDAQHPLRLMLGDLPSRAVSEIEVPALTVDAVRALAAGSGLDARHLHDATGGNPFFVTEVIAARGAALPSTVRDAVGARVGRLSAEAQRVLRAAAILGARVERALLLATAEGGGAPAGLRECLARGMLENRDDLVAFRHELARRAVLDSLPATDRVRLHVRALAALRSGVGSAIDAVRLANHAIETGNPVAIVELVPAAADQASRLGAHDEAADYLAVALALPESLADRTRAELLERYAYECSVADRIAASRSAEETALGLWRRLGDPLRVGNGMRALATYMWLGGEGDRARETAEAAVELLERIQPEGRELAHAHAKLAQLVLDSAQDDALARSAAGRAFEIAERIGDEPIAVHALTTLAIAEIYPGIRTGWSRLREAHRRAAAAGLAEDVVRVLINYVEAARDLKQYALADQYVDDAIAYLRDHEFGLYRSLLSSRIAQLALDRGRWDVAEKEATALLEGGARSTMARGRAFEVIGRLRARRGETGADEALDEALRIVGPGELQELCPLLAARAEAAWLAGDLVRCGEESVRGIDVATVTAAPFWYSELSFWAWRAGRIPSLPDGTEAPYALLAAGRYREAADAWAAIGSPYQEAAALAESPLETDLREALTILQPLRAKVLAGRVSTRLRELGARAIPRGPRASTTANTLGLTPREAEVLALIRRGARNADIAEQLVLSPKTVDHHVSAVLRKLRVPDREAARREAARLGLKDGELGRPD